MTTQNSNDVRLFVETKKENSFRTSKYLNLPDLQFLIGAIDSIRLTEVFIIRLINGFTSMELSMFIIVEFRFWRFWILSKTRC